MSRRVVVGISGGTGAGKTTVAGRIAESLSIAHAIVLQQEHYYKDFEFLPLDPRSSRNFDHPDSFDTQLLVEHVGKLRHGHAIERPIYDVRTHRREPRTLRAESRPIIIVEGILIFSDNTLRDLMDLKIFVDTPDDLRFIRRLERDMRERGRTADFVIQQYVASVRPMHMEFIEPSKRFADVIITEGGHDEKAISSTVQRIRSLAAAPSLLGQAPQ